MDLDVDNDPDYYGALGLPKKATLDEIRAKYAAAWKKNKELEQSYGGPLPGTFDDIQGAFDFLSDPANKEVYDAFLDEKERKERKASSDQNKKERRKLKKQRRRARANMSSCDGGDGSSMGVTTDNMEEGKEEPMGKGKVLMSSGDGSSGVTTDNKEEGGSSMGEPMGKTTNYYRTLNLPLLSTIDQINEKMIEIRKTYAEFEVQYGEAMDFDIFSGIEYAFSFLSDAQKKESYDKSLLESLDDEKGKDLSLEDDEKGKDLSLEDDEKGKDQSLDDNEKKKDKAGQQSSSKKGKKKKPAKIKDHKPKGKEEEGGKEICKWDRSAEVNYKAIEFMHKAFSSAKKPEYADVLRGDLRVIEYHLQRRQKLSSTLDYQRGTLFFENNLFGHRCFVRTRTPQEAVKLYDTSRPVSDYAREVCKPDLYLKHKGDPLLSFHIFSKVDDRYLLSRLTSPRAFHTIFQYPNKETRGAIKSILGGVNHLTKVKRMHSKLHDIDSFVLATWNMPTTPGNFEVIRDIKIIGVDRVLEGPIKEADIERMKQGILKRCLKEGNPDEGWDYDGGYRKKYVGHSWIIF